MFVGPAKVTRSSLILLALMALAAACLALGVWPPPEPVYRGKSLSLWVEDLDSTALFTQQKASEAIRQIGSDAVPSLVETLQSEDSALTLTVMGWVAKQRVVKIQFTPAIRRHRLAIRASRALGEAGRAAIPSLIPFLSGPLAHEAAHSLAIIDSEGIFPLTKAATNQQNEASIRAIAASQLASGRYEIHKVLPVLVTCLEDPDPRVSAKAAEALGTLREDPAQVVPALVKNLQNPNPSARRQTIQALAQFGPEADGALPGLRQALHDRNRSVRHEAVEALRRVTGNK